MGTSTRRGRHSRPRATTTRCGCTFEEDPDRGSQIEVTFTPEGPDTTRVDLTHRHLERYGPEAERMRRILDGKGGEPLAAFARYMATRAPAR